MEEERRDSGLGKLLGPRWLDRGEGSRACWTFRGKDGEAIRGLSRVPKSLPSSSSLLLRVASPPTPLLLRFCLYPLSILLFASLAVLTLLLFLLLLLYLFFSSFRFHSNRSRYVLLPLFERIRKNKHSRPTSQSSN